MATAKEIEALLAVSCNWCGAAPGRPCTVRFGKTVAVPSTLDGASHDARWRKALGREAKVIAGQIERVSPPRTPDDGGPTPSRVQVAVLERPW